MRIVSITNDIDSGGAAKSLSILAKNLVASGCALHIISISPPSRTSRRVEELESLGVRVDFIDIPYYPMSLAACPIPFWKNVRRIAGRLSQFKRLRRLTESIRPDVIHYNSYTTLLASLPLKGWPSVLHAREILLQDAPMLPLTVPLVRSRIQEIIAISPAEAEQAHRIFQRPTTLVFNPADIPERKTPMPDSDNLVYGMFSHVSPMKGHRLCVQACAKAADKLRRAKVSIRLFGGKIGIHETLFDSIESDIKAFGISDIMSFQGFAAEPEKEMQRIDLLLRPDLTGHPWGRDIIEAMSLARPVLATGDSEVFISKGKTGELVPPNDPDKFAEAMVRLADRATLERMGANAYEFAADNFDPGETSRQVLEILERAAARND